MDIKLEITLKDKDYGFSDLLDGRELNIETKKEILDLIKEDIGYAFDQQIEVKQLNLGVVSRSIGNDTKYTLKTMTKEQRNKHFSPCSICKLEKKCVNDNKIFDKCINENNENQYYG